VIPLSPILFNVVVDMLSILINRAKEENQTKGLVPNIIDEGLSILQYADNTILIIDHDFEKNIKYETITLCIWTIIKSQNKFP
jgi:hypothetical protein